ncbi:DUF3307 domain-containing protein [Alteromonas sp. BL110]|uniref:DUF3307 domain-containing protein n=1 Tax=Alteromonas sp. BL110 TaxID=1714845 RepID=UPI000E50CF0E|nr:DUF3307 domain-containing protein [Alteromonas sp. BL110]AXT40559.1 DUF3307 domain-containing protein [Alteromonas sp. BL110]RKM79795.1 DUF3307 domain-containing protein [Alteromonas sp. BL110]
MIAETSKGAIVNAASDFAQPQLLVGLLLAHLLADFYFQPHSWVKERNERHALALPLYLHALLHGALAFVAFVLLSGVDSMATISISVLIIAVSHFKIDVIKSYCSQSITAFVADQISHVLVILGVFLYATDQWHSALALLKSLGAEHLVVLLAYLAVLKPSSIIIKQLLSPWSSEVLTNKPSSAHPNDPPTITTEAQQTLSMAGQRIGYLERVLMLTFVLLNQFSAIGFLIAAKSIFRFGDLTKHQDRKLTEYVLLGTFTSVAMTLAIGLACAAVLGVLPVKAA